MAELSEYEKTMLRKLQHGRGDQRTAANKIESLVREIEQAERRAEEAERDNAEIEVSLQRIQRRAESAEQTIARVREWADERVGRQIGYTVREREAAREVLSLLEQKPGK